jgi:hypothetical protein
VEDGTVDESVLKKEGCPVMMGWLLQLSRQSLPIFALFSTLGVQIAEAMSIREQCTVR